MFRKARLKLTAWYLLIITIISLSFSVLIYQLINTEINHFADSQKNRIEKRLELSEQTPPPPIIIIDQDLIAESRQRLLMNLIIINGFILLISGSLSYFLAGRTLSPIKKMLEDQQRFTSDASHELRTPLTALKSLFEVSLRDKKLNLTEAKKIIKQGVDQADKLKNLSDSLLELNRFESIPVQLNDFKKISFTKVVSEAISQIQAKSSVKNITIINQVRSNYVEGDFSKIVEALIIFLDNAIKYSPDNSQIKLVSEVKNKTVLLKIIDHGVGISPKDLPHIFDRFYQADNARTKTNGSGYGLGLAIAKKIIESHRGKIEVSSKLNYGTTFIIYLPLFS